MKNRAYCVKGVVLLVWLSLLLPHSAWAQTKRIVTIVNSAPFESSPDPNGKQVKIQLQYQDADGKIQQKAIPFNVDKWDGKENQLKAQERKAQAIVDAITAAKLPGVKAVLVTKRTKYIPARERYIQVPVLVPVKIADPTDPKKEKKIWSWAEGPGIQISGLVQDDNNKKKPLTMMLDDVTEEALMGGPQDVPRKFDDPKKIPSMKGTMDGTGGLSSGVGASGEKSLISFGFYSDDTAVSYVATLEGVTDMTDSEILSQLAEQFNSLCGSCGYTAIYDAIADQLTFDRSLEPGLSVFTGDTDTGIEFNVEFQMEDTDPAMESTTAE